MKPEDILVVLTAIEELGLGASDFSIDDNSPIESLRIFLLSNLPL
jgi:hypothetical protein